MRLASIRALKLETSSSKEEVWSSVDYHDVGIFMLVSVWYHGAIMVKLCLKG